MKTTCRFFSLLMVLALALAGCGGGGSSTPAIGGEDALVPGGTGLTLDQVAGTAAPVNFSTALDVNDLNQVIGFAEVTVGADFSAALWTVNTDGAAVAAPAALDPIAGNSYSAAFAIDETGAAVGQSGKGAQLVAVIWPAGSVPVELPALVAAGDSAAYGISADGTLVVGQAEDATGATRAVIWVADASGEFVDPPTLLPGTIFASGTEQSRFNSASGVTRVAGDEILVAGEAVAGNGTPHAALWRSVDGGTSFSAVDLGADFVAYAVNSSRQVVGETDDTLAPVAWSISDQGVAAAPVALAAAGSAVAINENGRIAGWSGATNLATVWNAATPETLFASLSQAFGLNNAQQPLVVGRVASAGFVKVVN